MPRKVAPERDHDQQLMICSRCRNRVVGVWEHTPTMWLCDKCMDWVLKPLRDLVR